MSPWSKQPAVFIATQLQFLGHHKKTVTACYLQRHENCRAELVTFNVNHVSKEMHYSTYIYILITIEKLKTISGSIKVLDLISHTKSYIKREIMSRKIHNVYFSST